MRAGNKIFPYPVLNNDPELSGYKPSATFRIGFDTDASGRPLIEGGELIFKNLRYAIGESAIGALLASGRASAVFVVECPSTIFRATYSIGTDPTDLSVPVSNFSDKVVVSCFVYATEDIYDFRSRNFHDDYSGYSFNIDRCSILAVDDGYDITLDTDTSDDDKIASIFTIAKEESRTDRMMVCEDRDRRIYIGLAPRYYDSYDTMKRGARYNSIAFAMLAIPALTECLSRFCSSGEEEPDFADIAERKPWFRSVLKSYKKVTGKDLSPDEDISPFRIAQTVLNGASCEGLKDLSDMIIGLSGEEDEDE